MTDFKVLKNVFPKHGKLFRRCVLWLHQSLEIVYKTFNVNILSGFNVKNMLETITLKLLKKNFFLIVGRLLRSEIGNNSVSRMVKANTLFTVVASFSV